MGGAVGKCCYQLPGPAVSGMSEMEKLSIALTAKMVIEMREAVD